jgi:ADP-ribose pyrophosphatase
MTKRIQLIERKTLLDRSIFRVEEARFRQELHDGQWSEEVVRLHLERGDSAAALVHDPVNQTLVMVEQFRYPTFEKGPGWTLEIPAGIIDPKSGETPEETMRRELAEETGYDLKDLKRIYSFYPSPGGASERVYLFYAQTRETSRINPGGGDSSVGEFLHVVEVPVQDAFRKVGRQEIVDAKTIIGLQWLRLQLLGGSSSF